MLAIAMLAVVVSAQARAGDDSSFRVTHYDVQLEPRLESRTVNGTVTLSVIVHRDDVASAGTTITLDRGRLEIDRVQEGASGRAFVVDGSRVRITLPLERSNDERRAGPLDRPVTRTLTITYHGAPSSGLVFNAVREQIYTVFSTSQWMVAIDDPSARATLRLRLTMPRTWTASASGREIARREVPGNNVVMEWEQDRPVPTYTFGFAAGAFSEATDRASRTALRFLGRGFTESELRRVFGETAQMIAFFEERTGVPYPGDTYVQALVVRTAGQEMAGLSIVSEEYGRAVIDDPTADDRTIVYQKGAYALHELRELLGDAAFWAGIGRYTSEHFGRSVTTGDFRDAMEKASGRDLRAFFDRWVSQ